MQQEAAVIACFQRKAGESSLISLFTARCCLIEATGVERSSKELLQLGVPLGGVSLQDFIALVAKVQEEINEQQTPSDSGYALFDPSCKGRITEARFLTVLESAAPILSKTQGKSLFRAADVNSVDVVRGEYTFLLVCF